MSELRQNLASKEWVIIAPARKERPNHVVGGIAKAARPEKEHEASCPFCQGNHERFPLDVEHAINGEDGQWLVRAVQNKYKVLDSFEGCPTFAEPFEEYGIYRKLKGCGSHEVFIETNRHDHSIVDFSKEHLTKLFQLYVQRFAAFQKNPNNLVSFIFKNYGALAGQTQPHSHSQIVGSRVVPQYLRSLLFEAERHFDNVGSCVFCDMIAFEKKDKSRVLLENDHFIAFVPYAAGAEHESWILPKKHRVSILDISDAEIQALANIFHPLLQKYYHSVDNPDFNYVFRLPPYPLSGVPFYHWHIQIIPQTKIIGGFSKGTRIPGNTVLPEESARLLRECDACGH